MGNRASAFKWVFGTDTDKTTQNPPNPATHVLGSTGAGVAFNTHGWGENFRFFVETDGAATCAYQIRVARTSSGPWASMSSGTLSTGALDVVQLPGPLGWLSPRLKTLNSSANQVVVSMLAIES